MSKPIISAEATSSRHGEVLIFLFTDIEGSTQRWERTPEAMRLALRRHDTLVRSAIAKAGGHVFKSAGDAFCAVFSEAAQAFAAALDAQRSIGSDGFAEVGGLKVRMAIDAGTAEARDGDYFGRPLNRAARLLAAGHGGQVLVSEIAADLARHALPARSTLIALGPHYLKDFAEPQEIHQLAANNSVSAFPALRTLSITRGNLPQRVTSFIGRETEIQEIKNLLETNRLVTLVGSGGVGKTSATLRVGADLGSRFKEGVWFVELAPLTDPHLIPEIISSLFNAPIGTGSVAINTLSAMLRHKQALLILDNCEHLVAAIASLAETIIHSCPSISILASSREPLTIAGETVYRMPSLSFPKHTDSITADEALSYSAVQLFAERGRAAVNGFVVANDNAPAVAEICRRLDGIALAIELAAPRLKMLTPRELANRLDDQFRILTGGSRTALPRQQTLKALIDWSYNLLTEPERILLRRLSVFAGGCTMDGAAAVATDHLLQQSDIFDLMASLVDKSLVVADASGRATRYRLLEFDASIRGGKVGGCGGDWTAPSSRPISRSPLWEIFR